jgi:hypothetical protein
LLSPIQAILIVQHFSPQAPTVKKVEIRPTDQVRRAAVAGARLQLVHQAARDRGAHQQ